MLPQNSVSVNRQQSVRPAEKNPFEPIQNPAVRRLIQLAPWLMLAFLPLVAWPSNPLKIPGQVMFYTGFIAAGLALAAFNVLMERTFSTFDALKQRGVLGSAKDPQEPARENPDLDPYTQFRLGLAKALNNSYQWIMAAGFILLALTWYLYRRPISSFAQRPILIVGILAEVLISFLIGLMAWRMVVVSVKAWKLPGQFQLNLNVLHPDQCGGMEPLGNLCLWNALIIACAGVYLGGWIAIGPNTVFRAAALAYTPIFRALLVVPVVLAVISFLLPLWSTHQVMAVKKAEIQGQLDELAQEIFREDRELLDLADQLAPEDAEKRMKKLDTMRKIYSQYQKIPAWPINISIFSRFLASQAIPVLSLVGIAEPIAKILASIMQILFNSGS